MQATPMSGQCANYLPIKQQLSMLRLGFTARNCALDLNTANANVEPSTVAAAAASDGDRDG